MYVTIIQEQIAGGGFFKSVPIDVPRSVLLYQHIQFYEIKYIASYSYRFN